jgi:hypothetical protein
MSNESTLEALIEGLDQRGILVFQVLLGQQAMKLLSKDIPKDKVKSKILVPNNASNLRTLSKST